MQDGAVSYHRPDNVRRLKVEKNKPIVNALNKTKLEVTHPDLYQQQQDRERELVEDKKHAKKQRIAEEKEKEKERKLAAKRLKEYHEKHEEDIQATIERTRLENLNLSDDESDSEESQGSFLGF